MVIVVAILVTMNNNGRSPSMELVPNHSETPILNLYRNLDPQMTIAELSQESTAISPEMEIKLYQDGRGEVTMSNQTDVIRFYHNLGMIESEDNPEELNNDVVVDEDTVTEITDYQPTETIYNIEYLSFYSEAGYAIYYNEDENCYEVSDMGEVYQFDTKEDAIGAFLAPVVQER